MKKKNTALQVVLIIFFSILCLLIIFPFWLLVSVSLSSAETVAKGYQLIPNPVCWDAYKYVFEQPDAILRAYGVTFVYSVIAMVFSVLFMAMVAYPLSRKKLKGRGVLNFYLYFTMLFSGGLVPRYYLGIHSAGLDKSVVCVHDENLLPGYSGRNYRVGDNRRCVGVHDIY